MCCSAIEGHFFAEEDGEVAQEDLLEIWRALCEHRHPQLNTQPHNGEMLNTHVRSSTVASGVGPLTDWKTCHRSKTKRKCKTGGNARQDGTCNCSQDVLTVHLVG